MSSSSSFLNNPVDGPSTSGYICSPIDGHPDPGPNHIPADDPFLLDQTQSISSARHQAQLLTNKAYSAAIGYLTKWEAFFAAYQKLQLVYQELNQLHQNNLEDGEGCKQLYEEMAGYKDKYEISVSNQTHFQAVIYNKDLSIDSLQGALRNERDERDKILKEYVAAKKRWEDEKKKNKDGEERQLQLSGKFFTPVVSRTKKRKIKSLKPDHDRFTELEYELEEQHRQNRQLGSALAETRDLLEKSKKDRANMSKRLLNLDQLQPLPDRSSSSSTHSIRSDPFHIWGVTDSPSIQPSDFTPPSSPQKGMMPIRNLQGSEGISWSSETATLERDIRKDERFQGYEKEKQVEHSSTSCDHLAAPHNTELNMFHESFSGLQLPDSRLTALASLNMELRR
ncbi:hypothetical protein I204_07345 [Kwoniella mangroviensis CBS 8886]|nr:hypothetical protein I204_07345 [Kwoniella mangroviensis CBS 8886]